MAVIRVIRRVVVMVCMVLLAQAAFAQELQELQDIRAALAYPRKELIAKIDERKGGDLVAALILERALIKKRPDAAPTSPCDQVEESLKAGCILLISANAMNAGRFDELRENLATLDTRTQKQLFPLALLEKLMALPPTRVISQAETDIALSAQSEGFLQDSTHPVLDIELNGHKIKGTLDTGASVTVISEQDARQLDLTPLHYEIDIGTYYRAGQARGALYQAKALKIGNTQMRDVVVTVGGQMTLIGLDMISRFDSLYMSPDRIAINLSANELVRLEKACRVRVFLNSDFLRFNQFLYFIAKVDGKGTTVALDSGYSGDYLMTAIKPEGAVRDSSSSGVVSDARGVGYEQPYSSVVEVQAGNKTLRVPAIFSATRKLPAPYVLGWRGFSHYQLVYNVKSAKACLI